jgi:hypothetical protein
MTSPSDPDTTIPRRPYKDRLGRPITEPAAIEARFVQEQIARISLRKYKARDMSAPTIGEVAQATKLTPERVVEIVRAHEAWLWGLVERDGPVSAWGVFLDGE